MVLVVKSSAQTARPLAAHANLALYVSYQRHVGPGRGKSVHAQNREPSLTSIKVAAFTLKCAPDQVLPNESAEDGLVSEASPALSYCCHDSSGLFQPALLCERCSATASLSRPNWLTLCIARPVQLDR
jgi:hypothetical protein